MKEVVNKFFKKKSFQGALYVSGNAYFIPEIVYIFFEKSDKRQTMYILAYEQTLKLYSKTCDVGKSLENLY